MEPESKEEPTPKLTPSEAGTLEEKKAEDERALDELLGPSEDEVDILRATSLHTHYTEEDKALEKSQLELERKARREAPPVIRNPRNKPRPDQA